MTIQHLSTEIIEALIEAHHRVREYDSYFEALCLERNSREAGQC